METPIKMDDLGVPLLLETPIYIYTFLQTYHSSVSSIQHLLFFQAAPGRSDNGCTTPGESVNLKEVFLE